MIGATPSGKDGCAALNMTITLKHNADVKETTYMLKKHTQYYGPNVVTAKE